MNGRRKRILTSLGSLSFATLLAGIAFKRQLDKDLQKEMQGAGEKWNSPSPPCFARSLPPRGSLDVRKRLTIFALLCVSTMRQGEALERGRNLNRPLSSAYADTFPATVGFFALFSLRRKSEKGESKDKAADARHFPRRGKQGGGSAPMGKSRK